jgi:hypothetical protein
MWNCAENLSFWAWELVSSKEVAFFESTGDSGAGPRSHDPPRMTPPMSAFWQKHRIDDVDDAVLLVDVGNRHDGLAAFRVDDFESAAVLPHG